VRYRAHIQTIPARTSQRVRGHDLLLVPDHRMRRPRISPPHLSPLLRPVARRQAGHDAGSISARFTHSLLLQPDLVASSHEVCFDSAAKLPASTTSLLQPDVFIEPQFSRIFPAHPRSLASVLIPRPAATARLCFALRAPCGFRLSKNLCAKNAKRFPEPSEKAPLGLGSGAHSRRFAQECPEGNPGKYQTGEMTCNSMKTKSS
jgi:hypothetical protein